VTASRTSLSSMSDAICIFDGEPLLMSTPACQLLHTPAPSLARQQTLGDHQLAEVLDRLEGGRVLAELVLQGAEFWVGERVSRDFRGEGGCRSVELSGAESHDRRSAGGEPTKRED